MTSRPVERMPLDLLLQGTANPSELQLFLVAGGVQQAFSVALPPQLEQAYAAWRHRFLAFHTSPSAPATSSGGPSPDALRHYESQLLALMQHWLEGPAWQPLQQRLAQDSDAPLRLRFVDLPSWIERLPWELLPLQRPIWRLADGRSNPASPEAKASGSPGRPRRPHRQPRLLLLVGQESGLSLEAEIQALSLLQRQGRISLSSLRGDACNLAAIRTALADGRGWDGLLFLGHSEADTAAGGRLHLGDGSWLTAQTLQADLHQAAQRGLALVLLSSCSGLDLARSAVASGVSWAVCFREPVPCGAAAGAFCSLLEALVQGCPLPDALSEARQSLERSGPPGTRLLLSLVASPLAPPLQLPLRKRRVVALRLASSSKGQAIAAAAFTLVALAAEVVPWNPISQSLLDHRLRLQREWRQITHQPGPSAPALPLLLLEPRRAYPALGVPPAPGRQHLSRLALLRVLERTPPASVPRLGLDVVLDDPAIEPAVTQQLAALIRQQGRAEVFAGFYGAASDGHGAGELSRPLPLLQQAGLGSYDLAVGTPPCPAVAPCRRPLPLQLTEPIQASSFAQALSGQLQRYLPADAVLDWSLPWDQLIRRIEPAELPALQGPVLLVGSDGQLDPQQPDLFEPPAAIQPLLERWALPSTSLPGVVVQAVLAQSLTLHHWLRPASLAATTALASGLGVLLAAAQVDRRRQLQLLGLIAVMALLLSFQLVAGAAILIPLVLPLAALATTTLLRRD